MNQGYKSERIYCGSGKQTQDFCIRLDVCLTDIGNNKQYIREFNGKKYITLDLMTLKNPDPHGKKTHSISINTFKKDQANAAPQSQQQAPRQQYQQAPQQQRPPPMPQQQQQYNPPPQGGYNQDDPF